MRSTSFGAQFAERHTLRVSEESEASPYELALIIGSGFL
jgi:hypothetical protein